MTSIRVDAELVRRGLARSRAHAAELVRAGRVSADGRVVAKPSAALPAGAGLDIVADNDDPGYASRAALKLAGVLDALGSDDLGRRFADVSGAWCLDVGASTGGFTDVLLRRGAAHVVALDVGHGQLLPRLREDPRVTVVEGYNVRDLDRADLERTPDLVVGDLSFISLTLVLSALAQVLDTGRRALLMVKPQFEVGKDRIGTGGVVRDPALHLTAVLDVVAAARGVGMHACAVVPSPLPGPSGNREYFVAFERGEPAGAFGTEVSTRDAVAAAVGWTPDVSGAARPPVFAVRSSILPTPAARAADTAAAATVAGAQTKATQADARPAAGDDAYAGADPTEHTPSSAGVDPDPSTPTSRTGGAP